ncbi:MAG: hypothetical protein AAF755_13655 [Pseudomonadota bacterium]
MSADHKLSQGRPRALLSLSRSNLDHQPVGVCAANLKIMEIIRRTAGDLRTQIWQEGQAVFGNPVVRIAANGAVPAAP